MFQNVVYINTSFSYFLWKDVYLNTRKHALQQRTVLENKINPQNSVKSEMYKAPCRQITLDQQRINVDRLILCLFNGLCRVGC